MYRRVVFLPYNFRYTMSKVAKILLVEDEKSLRDVIALNLKMKGYEVSEEQDGAQALQRIQNAYFDLVILDIMLPTMSGFDVCKAVREQNSTIQILMVSAKDSSADKIEGLKLGADDYLPKPFDLEELLLRVESLLRRNPNLQTSTDSITFGNNKVDFTTFEATNGSEQFQLTKREIDILELLVEKEGEVVSREDLLRKVWGYEVIPNTRTIDNYILAFRKYFEQDPKNPQYFHSVWGVGYRFTAK